MKDFPAEFDDIRPYTDAEIPAAMQRIAQSEAFPLLASWVYPDKPLDEVREMVKGFTTAHDFQLTVMRRVNEQVIARSITQMTTSGLENLSTEERYVFVSNHRDIMLDASLLQLMIVDAGHETTEITFGANLMSHPTVIDVGKSNKMFRVERGGNMRDFYRSSLHLSRYIRYDITERHESVWIAQRNGRTKDGSDRTDQGIIKMFAMSKPEDKIAALAELHIVPTTISYEWEPCDLLKAIELYQSRTAPYVKKPGEDLNSILTGIVAPKGRVHLAFGKPITRDDLLAFNDLPTTQYHREVANLLDQRIIAGYRLTPNNYIAHDMRYGQQRYRDHYSDSDRAAFVAHLEAAMARAQVDEPDALRDIFLTIYAAPVDSHTAFQ